MSRLTHGNKGELLSAIFAAVSITIHDKLPQVVQTSLLLLQNSIEELQPDTGTINNTVFKK